jgi:hypothetical protein
VDDIKDVLGQAEEENVIPAENNMYKIRIRPLNVLEVSYNANLTIGVYNAVKRIMDHSRHGLNNHIYERRTFERPMDGLSHRLSDLKLRVSRLESACLDRGVARFSLGY